MATTIKLKNSVTTTNAPSSLVQGEVAINITDKKVWVGNAATTPIQLLGAGASINLTSLTTSNDCSISGLTVGKGGGAVASNTALGLSALAASATGTENTGVGASALTSLTSGSHNTAIGRVSLQLNTTGTGNSAVGRQALNQNTSGGYNVAVGYTALLSNTTGSYSVGIGTEAGYFNTTGEIVGIGYQALKANTTGNYNTAIGNIALTANTTGANNTAVGRDSLASNTTASNNTAVGYQAGYTNAIGNNNTFIGRFAGFSANPASSGDTANLCVGSYAGYSLTTGKGNTFIGGWNPATVAACGYYMTTGSSNTIIGGYNGNQGGLDIRTASNQLVLSDGDGVWGFRVDFPNNKSYFNALGTGAGNYTLKLTTATGEMTYDTSSARYKDNIRNSKYGLADVLKMRSAQFEYKDTGNSDVGFIAEEMVNVIPELVVIDKQGRPDAVSYDRMTSVLVKAIQELNAKVEAQALEIAQLKGN